MDVPIYKVAEIRIGDNSPIKSWEISNDSLILKIPFYYPPKTTIMEYHIPLMDLKKALKED